MSNNNTESISTMVNVKSEVHTFKLVAIFVLCFCSLLGVAIPIYLGNKFSPEIIQNHGAFSIFRSFSAGIIISLGFIHLLCESSEILQEIYPDYPPLAFAIAITGVLFVLTIEQVTLSILHSSVISNDGILPKHIEEIEQQITKAYGTIDEHKQTKSHESILQAFQLTYSKSILMVTKAYILQLSISMHSIIIGIDFGTMSTEEDFPLMRALIVALSFHQFFEGNSLGLMFCETRDKFGLTQIILFTVFFSIQVSVGIVIGMIIINDFGTNTNYDENSLLYSTSCLDSFAAGILIYTGLVEMISEEFSNNKVQSNSLLKAAMIFAFSLGLLCMAIIGMWA
jgi:zinc transporter 1/2/3